MLFLAASALIVASCGKAKYDAKLNQTHTNSELGFSFAYPSGWDKAEYEPNVVFFQAPERNNFSASVGIIISDEDKRFDEMTQNEFLGAVPKDIKDFNLIDFKKTAFAGQSCIMAVFDSTGNFGKTRQREYVFNRNGKLYTLVFIALQNDFEYYDNIFNKIAQTFTFNGAGS